MEHGMNCPHHADKDEACTCAVTERTMHAAWRKRAEEAEARIAALETALAAMTMDRDAQAEAVRVLGGECFEWRLAHVCSPVSLIDAPIIRARKRTMNNPIAAAALKGGTHGT